MTNLPTPRDKSAANIRHKMEGLGTTIGADESKSNQARFEYQTSLSKTINQNYRAAIQALRSDLDNKQGSHLSIEVLESSMRGLISAAIWDKKQDLQEILVKCDSAAEELFAIALETVSMVRSLNAYWNVSQIPDEDDVLDHMYEAFEDGVDAFIHIEPQGEVWPNDMVDWGTKPYRADFLITCMRRTNNRRLPVKVTQVAIEIDGRHHATDERRSRDNERDRVFRELGIVPDRYTGKDIIGNPFACAERAIDHLLSL